MLHIFRVAVHDASKRFALARILAISVLVTEHTFDPLDIEQQILGPSPRVGAEQWNDAQNG
jgi:hypothetical protein